jgi:hypothetical protein
MAGLFKKAGNSAPAYKRQLHDVQFSQIKDTLRKKNKAKTQAESVVMEW